jgi:hypothetical protein
MICQDKSIPECWYVNCSGGIPIQGTETIRIYNAQMEECNWKTFGDFGNCAFGLWKITINKDNWKLSTCTCPIYFKQYICKHITGISILLKIVGNQMPNNARDDVIGGPRGCGRPRKAVKALLEQRQFRSLQETDLSELDDNDDDEVVDASAPSNQASVIVNHNYEPNEYSEYVPPLEQVQQRYRENFIPVESLDSNYATDSNCTDLDSILSKTLYPLNVDHLSHISLVSNTFLSEPNPFSSRNVNSTNNFDQKSSNSKQSFGNSVYATVNANSISNVNSNFDIQLNSEQANCNPSLNISTFNPNPSFRDIIDEDIDDAQDVEVENASQAQIQVPVQAQAQAQVTTTKGRGCPPLSLEEVERRDTLKASEKLKNQASKRAKIA